MQTLCCSRRRRRRRFLAQLPDRHIICSLGHAAALCRAQTAAAAGSVCCATVYLPLLLLLRILLLPYALILNTSVRLHVEYIYNTHRCCWYYRIIFSNVCCCCRCHTLLVLAGWPLCYLFAQQRGVHKLSAPVSVSEMLGNI